MKIKFKQLNQYNFFKQSIFKQQLRIIYQFINNQSKLLQQIDFLYINYSNIEINRIFNPYQIELNKNIYTVKYHSYYSLMLSHHQTKYLSPFFKQYQSHLIKLKSNSISTYNEQLIIQQSQLFYPWGQRKIFYNIKMKTEQLNAINQVKSLIIEKEEFQIDYYSQVDILRHLHSANLNIKKCYQRLKSLKQMIEIDQKQQMKNDKGKDDHFLKYLYYSQNHHKIQTHLKNGIIYTLGKTTDKGLPIVILQVNKINTSLSSQQNFSVFYTLISTVLHYRMKPHWQQKYIFIIDLGLLSFSQIPYQYMYKFMQKIGLIFGGLCQKIFVYNSQKIGLLWHMCKKWLPDSTVNKIIFADKNNIKPVTQLISLNQLEIKYGGQLLDITEYWPPKPVCYHQQQQQQQPNSSISQPQQLNYEQQDENTTQYLSFKQQNSRFESSMMLNSAKYIKHNTSQSGQVIKKKSFYTQNIQQFEQYQVQKQQPKDSCNSFCGGVDNQYCSNNCEIF